MGLEGGSRSGVEKLVAPLGLLDVRFWHLADVYAGGEHFRF